MTAARRKGEQPLMNRALRGLRLAHPQVLEQALLVVGVDELRVPPLSFPRVCFVWRAQAVSYFQRAISIYKESWLRDFSHGSHARGRQ